LVTTLEEWLKTNASFRTLVGHLAQREGTVRRAIRSTTAHLADHFRRHPAIAWPPTLRDVLADVPVATATDIPGIIAAVDTTEIPTQRPTVYESRYFSVRHRQHGMKFQVGCLGERVPRLPSAFHGHS